MRPEPPGRLGLVGGGLDPIWQAWNELPQAWRGPMIGPGIEDWGSITENGDRRIDLTGLPEPFGAELAWMAHWQAMDGTRSSVLTTNQLANILFFVFLSGSSGRRAVPRAGGCGPRPLPARWW